MALSDLRGFATRALVVYTLSVSVRCWSGFRVMRELHRLRRLWVGALSLAGRQTDQVVYPVEIVNNYVQLLNVMTRDEVVLVPELTSL